MLQQAIIEVSEIIFEIISSTYQKGAFDTTKDSKKQLRYRTF